LANYSYIIIQVGDLPTRFKYVPVPTQTYSLTPVEILLATDKELNEYVSVKKYAPYRQEKDRSRWDNKEKEKLREFKAKLGERVGDRVGFGMGNQEGGEGGEKVKKRKGKKERMKMKAAVAAEVDGELEVDVPHERSRGKDGGEEKKAR
jgi:protein KRI1